MSPYTLRRLTKIAADSIIELTTVHSRQVVESREQKIGKLQPLTVKVTVHEVSVTPSTKGRKETYLKRKHLDPGSGPTELT